MSSQSGRFIVSGRVQGVGFRWSAQRRAEDLGLAGWVRNLPDGRVEVMAAGDRLAELEEWLQEGPRWARVEAVEKHDVPHEVELTKPFKIS